MSRINSTIRNLSASLAYATKVRLRKCRKKVKVSARKGCMTRLRRRKRVYEVYNELGRNMFRRAYRMHIETFFELYQCIKKDLFKALSYNPNRHFAPNGRIHPTVRLACAIRMFCGAQAVDVACTFGVSVAEVHFSVNYVIDATNLCDRLSIVFPSDHDKQREIAQGFKRKSQADIDVCVGPIDGLLVWIDKLSEKECSKVGVGSKKFFCGRKKKFGLNLQATCDHKNRFTNISIMFPGSTSDFLAFEASDFRRRLEEPGFLAPGLCLFGDNAYVNRFYMATPFQNVPVSDPKDHYNFYHSQLRIMIECTFGIFVNRWGILRKPLPRQFGLEKMILLVECLARLHNFLIDVPREPVIPIQNTAEDRLQFQLNGALEMEDQSRDELGGRSVSLPNQILHGGEHYDDDPDAVFRQRSRYLERQTGGQLPRNTIYQMIRERDLRRPSRRTY